MSHRREANGKLTGVIARLSIPITVGLIAGFAAAIFVLLFQVAPSHRELWKFAITAVGVAAGVTSGWYIGTGLRDWARAQEATTAAVAATREARLRSERIQRVFDFATRWHDPALIPAKAAFMRLRAEIQKKKLGPAERERVVEEAMSDKDDDSEDPNGPGIRHSVMMLLNLLEEMALAVNKEAADEELARLLWRGTVRTYFDLFHSWITERRTEAGNDRILIEVQHLRERWGD